MKYSIVFTALSLFSLHQIAHALPAKRDAPSDVDILNFALTLEHLENAYYQQGLSKYSEQDFLDAGLPQWARGRFQQVAAHEKTHVEFLTTAISAAGAQPVQPCEYKFPDTDAKSFVAISEALESVGTSAYNGAAAFISNKDYLTVAASILSIEARHAAWINSAVRKINPWSTAFETPLGLNQVYTIASGFIKSCPASNKLPPVHAFPALSVPANALPGKRVVLSFTAPSGDKQLFAAFLTGTGTVFAKIDMSSKKVKIPKGLEGSVYVIVTDDGGKAEDLTTVAGPVLVMFGFDSEGKVV